MEDLSSNPIIHIQGGQISKDEVEHSASAGIPRDGIREQSRSRSHGSFVADAPLGNRVADTDRLSRMGKILRWVLDAFVKWGWINGQSASNLLTYFLIVIKDELDGPQAATLENPRVAEEPERPRVENQPSEEAATSESIQKASSSSEVSHAEPVQRKQESSKPKLAIRNPQSEVHTRRMEGPLAHNAAGNDPSKYCSPRNYRSHLNAELLAKESPFLLEDAFFEGSQGGSEWQKSTGEIPTTEEDNNPTLLETNGLGPQNPQEVALRREVDALWPGKNEGGISFSKFIFGEYRRAFAGERRYDLISSEERQLLKNIVIQAKALKKELAELRKELDDLKAANQTPSQELEQRIELLRNGLASIETIIRGHGNVCHLRLQEIVRTSAQRINCMVNYSNDINSPEAVTKQILAQYRLQLCNEVMDPNTGSFLREDHRVEGGIINFEAVNKAIEEAAKQGYPLPRSLPFRYLAGRHDEVKQAARLVVSEAWGLNEPKVATNAMHEIPQFQFKDFVDPFVQRLGLDTLVASAKKTFSGLSGESLGTFAKTFLKSEVTFEDYCTILGLDIDETWKKFEEAIKNSEEDPEGNYINEETKPAQQAAIETL
ncbi:MAG: septum formation initiator family protein, partial [Holosporales bacterium]|nr:septum formation initiator family protein [Holosporales bacterium]